MAVFRTISFFVYFLLAAPLLSMAQPPETTNTIITTTTTTTTNAANGEHSLFSALRGGHRDLNSQTCTIICTNGQQEAYNNCKTEKQKEGKCNVIGGVCDCKCAGAAGCTCESNCGCSTSQCPAA